jgi:hypothetical protein
MIVALPVAKIFWMPPELIVLLVATPSVRIDWEPPATTTVSSAIPPETTFSTPLLLTLVSEVKPESFTPPPLLTVVSNAVPPAGTFKASAKFRLRPTEVWPELTVIVVIAKSPSECLLTRTQCVYALVTPGPGGDPHLRHFHRSAPAPAPPPATPRMPSPAMNSRHFIAIPLEGTRVG